MISAMIADMLDLYVFDVEGAEPVAHRAEHQSMTEEIDEMLSRAQCNRTQIVTAPSTVTASTKPDLKWQSGRLVETPILGGVADQPLPSCDSGSNIGGFPTVRRALPQQVIRTTDQTLNKRIGGKLELVHHHGPGESPLDELALP
jgi:hypothetical protein